MIDKFRCPPPRQRRQEAWHGSSELRALSHALRHTTGKVKRMHEAVGHRGTPRAINLFIKLS